MPLPEHTEPRELRDYHDSKDELRPYWRDGRAVRYREFELTGADAANFRFWAGSFGTDGKGVWCASKRLRGVDAASFRMENLTWARDAGRVWTLGGELKGVQADHFRVSDDGVYVLPSGVSLPYGYACDDQHVYYYDFSGKPKLVRKADAASFESCNDGHFAVDARVVFCAGSALPAAKPASWRRLGGFYSADGSRIYYHNRRVKHADAACFRVVATGSRQLARDAQHFWRNDVEIDRSEFERLTAAT